MNDLDNRLREAEIRKLEAEAAATQATRVRGWINSLSVVVGIIVSSAGIYQSMIDLAFKNRQLGIEAQVRSHEIFLNQVLDRLSGIKVSYYEQNEAGELRLARREEFGGTTQVGAYAAAVSLACEFENLRRPAIEALAYQATLGTGDPTAQKMLAALKNECTETSN